MKNRARVELVHETRHLDWLEAAREIVDKPSAQEAGVSLDDAYAAFEIMEELNMNPLIPNMTPWHEPSSEMTTRRLFQVVSGLDTLLLHGNAVQARQAATRATELVDVLPQSTESDIKSGILANVLGIEIPSEVSVEEQLVGRYFPAGAPEEQLALAGLISSDKRTTVV